MKTSPAGRAAIEQREGFELRAYRDQRGIPTIGVGHTSMAGPPHVYIGLMLTKAEVDQVLSRDLVQFEDAVNRDVHPAMTQNEFDALVSLAFNIGVHGFTGSAVVHFLNAGDRAAAAKAFLNWEHPSSLRARREGEMRQFLTP